MKTIITTICLAIILQFSAQTSVYADTATICAGEKYRAQHFAEPMSEKCRNYGQSSNLIPKILLGIVVLVIGIPLVAFLFAGIVTIKEKALGRSTRESFVRMQKLEMIKNYKASLNKYSKLEQPELVKKLKSFNSEILKILGSSYKKTDDKKALLKKIMTYELNECTKDLLIGLADHYKVDEVTMKNTKAQIVSAILSKSV